MERVWVQGKVIRRNKMWRQYRIKGNEEGEGRGVISVGQCKGKKEGGKSEESAEQSKKKKEEEEAKSEGHRKEK